MRSIVLKVGAATAAAVDRHHPSARTARRDDDGNAVTAYAHVYAGRQDGVAVSAAEGEIEIDVLQ
jgi:hypothetical protein